MIHVLVVDDDVAVAELMRVLIEDLGARVDVASGADALPPGRYDCVLTDLVTVGVYSFEDARDWVLLLRDRYPGAPVIVATAHVAARTDADRLGANVLVKPFDVDDLTAAVRAAVG